MSKRAWFVAAIAIGLAIFLYMEVQPAHAPVSTKPGWLEDIFSSRVLLGIVRVGIIAAVIYGVLSVSGLLSEGRWLSELGPAKASKAGEQTARLGRSLESVESSLDDARGTIGQLEGRLSNGDEALAQLQRDLQLVLDYVASVEGEGDDSK
jgi:hypothetical protein